VNLTVHTAEETPRCPSQSAPWVEKGPPARRIEWRMPPPPGNLSDRTAFRRCIARRLGDIEAGNDPAALLSLRMTMPVAEGVPQLARADWPSLMAKCGNGGMN
jgi:hypothetical protein